jgi:hypothetical protein
MLIVFADPGRVEAVLLAGGLGCPVCGAALGPWGHARERVLRCRGGDRRLLPRRARCRGCLGTHVLLPDIAFLRRRDEVGVIGAAVAAHVAGVGYRRIAGRLGVPADTVRGWLSRFGQRCAVLLDPELGAVLPAQNSVADALEAIAVCGRAWVLRFGPAELWPIVSRVSGGLLVTTRVPAFPWPA